MVRRVLHLVYKEVRGLHQAAYVLALFAFGSQLLALVRDRLLAGQFGAGAELDIYYTAFRIPDVLYVLFASTLSVYVLIPFVTKYQSAGDDTAAAKVLSQIFTLFLTGYTLLALLIFILAPYITPVLFPGITDQATLVMVLRVLLLQPLLLGVSSLFGVVTQLGHRFILYALSPLVYNLGIIIGIIAFYPWLGLTGIAWGVVLGAMTHMAIQWPLVRQSVLAFRVVRYFDWTLIGAVLKVSVPRALTLAGNQMVWLALISMAGVMAVGSVSVLQFAHNLQSVPLAIIGVSYSVAAFPALAEMFAKQEYKKFAVHITTALRHIIFWAVPATVLIIVLRAQIVRVVLGNGAFDWSDTRLTAAILAVLVIALCAHAVQLLMVRAFYAGGDTKTPLLITVIGSSMAVAGAYFATVLYSSWPAGQELVLSSLRVTSVPGTEVLALAFGYVAVMLVQSIVLVLVVSARYNVSLRFLPAHLLRSAFAALLGGLMAYGTLQFLVDGLNTDTFIGITLQGGLAGVVGVVGVILGYAALRSPELSEAIAAIERKIFKTDVIAPQDDVL